MKSHYYGVSKSLTIVKINIPILFYRYFFNSEL